LLAYLAFMLGMLAKSTTLATGGLKSIQLLWQGC